MTRERASDPRRLRRRSRAGIALLAALVVFAGCTTVPKPPSTATRTGLGRVAVVALPSSPRVEFHTFAKGWAAGATKGGAQGLVTGLLSAIVDLNRNPPTGPYAGVFTLVGLAVEGAVATVVYGVAGGVESVPVKTARRVEGKLRAELGAVRLADDLVGRFLTVAGRRRDLDRYGLTSVAASGGTSGREALSAAGISTTLAMQVTEAGFRGGSRLDPTVRFYLNAHVRLLDTATGTEVYARDFQYLSRARQFEDWFAAGSAAFATTFDEALDRLSDRIADEIFLTTKFPFESGILALPGRSEFGSCWFYPIEPAAHYTSLWYSFSHNAPGVHLRYTRVDSPEPLLRWEPFPRPRDLTPDHASVLSRISDVSYDVKIWEAVDDYPDRLVYDVGGLAEPAYRPSPPLQAGTRYFWTFRARYKLAGEPQVTRWAFSNIPSNLPSDYPQRPAGGGCALDGIPSTNYFRFATP